jgi:hypothetical protein
MGGANAQVDAAGRSSTENETRGAISDHLHRKLIAAAAGKRIAMSSHCTMFLVSSRRRCRARLPSSRQVKLALVNRYNSHRMYAEEVTYISQIISGLDDSPGLVTSASHADPHPTHSHKCLFQLTSLAPPARESIPPSLPTAALSSTVDTLIRAASTTVRRTNSTASTFAPRHRSARPIAGTL